MSAIFDYEWRWYTWVAFILFVAAIPVGLVIPKHWGWENGVLETIQTILLLFGAYASYKAARSFPVNHRMRKFWFWTLPFWGLVLAREFSFGRSFYPYYETSDGVRQEMGVWNLCRIFCFVPPWSEEPCYPVREEMLIGDSIYFIVLPIAIATVIALVWCFDWKNIKRVIRIPVVLAVLIVLSGGLAEIVEQDIIPPEITGISAPQSAVFEEIFELVGYWCLAFVVFANAFPKSRNDISDTGTDASEKIQ